MLISDFNRPEVIRAAVGEALAIVGRYFELPTDRRAGIEAAAAAGIRRSSSWRDSGMTPAPRGRDMIRAAVEGIRAALKEPGRPAPRVLIPSCERDLRRASTRAIRYVVAVARECRGKRELIASMFRDAGRPVPPDDALVAVYTIADRATPYRRGSCVYREAARAAIRRIYGSRYLTRCAPAHAAAV